METDEAVAEFIAATGAPADEARGYLEMAGGELQAAVSMFFDMGGGGDPPSPAMRPTQSPATSPMAGAVVDEDVAAEVAAAAAAAGIDTGHAGGIPDATMADAGADEVRAPMPAYQDQIINPEMERRRMQEAIAADSQAMNRRMTFDRTPGATEAGAGGEGGGAEGERGMAINKLFEPPSYNEPAPYYQTVEKAKAEGKWILVNIQQAEVFASHTLNRDVWRDDTIRDVVLGSFLFWQRDDKSTEGDQFCQYYQCGHQLPHICVIDPRTMRRVKAWDGRKWTESHDAAEFLFSFLDEFSMSRSPPANSPAASPHIKPQDAPATDSTGGDMQLTGLDVNMGTSADEALAPPVEGIAAEPEEPPEDTQHLKVSFKLPSGQRVTRRFLPDAPVEQMFAVASRATEQPMSRIDLSTQFPKRSLRNIEGGMQALMKDAQVAGSMVLVNVLAA